MAGARVLFFAKLDPERAKEFEAAFGEVAEKVRDTPGMTANLLLREEAEPGSYVIVSEWESREAFLTWEDDPTHREVTKPLQGFWSGAGTQRRVYDVAVGWGAGAPDAA